MKTTRITLDDLVFRARNKAYGAYRLRQESAKTTRNAFIYGASLMLFFLLTPLLISNLYGSEKVVEEDPIVCFDCMNNPLDKPTPEPEPTPPPPPSTPTPPPPPTVAFKPPVIVEDHEAPQTMPLPDIDSLDGKQIGNRTETGNGDGSVDLPPIIDGSGSTPIPDEIIKPEPVVDPPVVDFPSEAPKAVNLSDFKQKMRFPPILLDGGVDHGKVVVRVLIDQNGDPIKHKVLKTDHDLFTAEVVKHIPKLKFTPAIHQNKAVKAWVTIPVNFTSRPD